MSDDLVKRLRDWSEYDEGKINDAREEAADRIKDLHFQISVIQGAAAHAKKSYEEHLAVYRQKLEEKPPIWHDDIQSLQERDAIMTDRIEKLEAALRTIYECCDETGNCSVVRRIVRKALEGKDE